MSSQNPLPPHRRSLRQSLQVSSLLAALVISLPALAISLPAQQESGIPQLAESAQEIADAVLAKHEDPREHYLELWRKACAEHGTVEPLIVRLRAMERDERRIEHRDATRRLLARVLRRAGRLDEALEVLARIHPDLRTNADTIARAEILDAQGRDQEALALYEELTPKLEDPELRKRILLRRALMGKGTEELAKFAKSDGNTEQQRNEAAMVLALRGDQKNAIESFVATGEGTARFRQEIRRAEWAIEAGLFDEAQQAAWIAVRNAKLSRDRRYALSVLASAYRRNSATGELLKLLEGTEDLSSEGRKLWIRLLREEGRADDALRLFREAPKGSFDSAMRRQLLEICRETGRAEVLVSAFERLIQEEPGNLEWRSGLSRYYLEQGLREKALAVWQDIEQQSQNARQLMDAAFSLDKIGLSDVAQRLARQASRAENYFGRGLLFIFNQHEANGRQDDALAVLQELEQGSSGSSALAAVADGYERLGRPDLAVKTLERLRESLGGYLGSDLEMKLAILLSRVQRDEEALEIWRGLWSRLRSTPRGRFVEDRMMTVASRTGALAKIAIELEDRLAAGKVNAEGIEMLVRLYIKVGDPASATEVVEEFMGRAGGNELELLKRKAKIYLACQDYHHYEKVIHELVEKDEENRLDHLRELAMSNLERGRRDLAVELLPRIREISEGEAAMADEFEAGVYGLCGMKEEALAAYIRGMGRNPGRIDTYLLISNLMRETGGEMAAARMFQFLAQTAPKDDLFTIAIDGILNLRAHRGTRVPISTVRWALRTTLERLAAKPGKFYLYRLVTDLASELNDMPFAIRTLKAGLPVAGERRTPILREVMAKARSQDPASRASFGRAGAFSPSPNWDATDYVMVGRRLLGQGDHVPPQTFMNLAAVFLREDDVQAAVRTFNRAAEVLDYAEVLREAARVLEAAGRPKHALQYYARLLAAGGDDVALIQKIASLEEQMGNQERAFEFYSRGMSKILAREARYVAHAEEQPEGPIRYYGGNVSIEDQLLPKFIDGMVLNASESDVLALLDLMREKMDTDLATVPEDAGEDPDAHRLANYPRLAKRAEVWRRLVLSRELLERAAKFDTRLLQRFPQDRQVSMSILRSRAQRGLERDARALLAKSPLSSDPEVRLAAGVVDASSPSLSVAAAARLVVPLLTSQPDDVRDLLERVDTGVLNDRDKSQLANLLSACVLVDARAPAERVARAGLRSADVRRDFQLLQDTLSMAARLSPDLAKRLLREKLRSIAEDQPTAMLSFVRVFQQIDASLGGDSIDSEAATSLIKKLAEGADRSRPYIYFTSLLDYVDEAERCTLVKELHDILSPTQRPRLLLDSIHYLDPETIEPSFVEWFQRSLKVALEAGGENVVRSVSVSFGRSGGQKRSAELALAAIEVVSEFQPNVRNDAERVGVLIELDRVDEAFECAEESVERMLADQQMGRYAFQRMTGLLNRPELRDRTAAFLKAVEEKHPNSSEVRGARWQLLRQRDPERLRKELLATLETDPKNLTALTQLWSIERASGSPVRALRAVERLVEAQPSNGYYKSQLNSYRQRLLSPAHVRELAKAKKLEKEKRTPKAPSSGRTVTGARSVAARATRATVIGTPVRMISSSGVMTILSPGGTPTRIRVDAKAREILDLHAKGKKDEARQLFRRYWRNFDQPNRYIQFPRNLRPGFFKQFGDQLPWLAEEARAVLRVLPRANTAAIRAELYDILTAELRKNAKPEEEIASRRKAVLAGTATADDVEILLRLLDASEEKSIDQELMQALLTRLELLDSERLERLARLCAKSKRIEEGVRLYRLAILSNSSASQQLQAKIEPIKELFGEEAEDLIIELVDDLSIRMQGYRFTQWANMAVDVWSRVLSPEAAAEKMLQLKRHVIQLAEGSPMFGRNTPRGDLVALTLARAGRYEEALSELENWLRDSKTVQQGIYNRVSISASRAMQRALAADGEWEDRAAWLRALANQALAWHDAGELLSVNEVLGALTEQLWKLEERELASRCLEGLLGAEADRPAALLARAKVLRVTEREAEAFAIERKLLEADSLPIDRIADNIERIRKQEGAEAALSIGSKAAEYTWQPALLALLSSCAAELGQDETAESWQEKKALVDSVLPPKKPAPQKAGSAAGSRSR